MKVFKFTNEAYYYAFAAETEQLAIDQFIEEIGDDPVEIEEIPESEWDKKIIEVREDNDMSKKPYKQSIRETICGTDPQMVFTNDRSLF